MLANCCKALPQVAASERSEPEAAIFEGSVSSNARLDRHHAIAVGTYYPESGTPRPGEEWAREEGFSVAPHLLNSCAQTLMPSAPKAGILAVRRQSGYKDIPGIRYHFPKANYLKDVLSLVDALVLLYEPRRGGTSTSSGGRSAFTAFAFIDRVWDDPDDPTHAFLSYRYFTELIRIVPLSRTTVSAQSLQRAVRAVDYREAEEVVRHGLFVESSAGVVRQGLTDIDVLMTVRETREVISNRAVRDATFRYRVVEEAYDGRCALTGVRMTNGNGRAEADAAHIQPVEAGGPDSTRNGLALMKSFHWAFDRGLVSLSDEGKILTVQRGIEASVLRMLPPDLRAHLPSPVELRPHPAFLKWHRDHVFKGSVPLPIPA